MMKKHPNHIALGIGMMMIGMWLITNDHFFMWKSVQQLSAKVNTLESQLEGKEE